jgi:lipoate-protein ligase A
MVNGKKLLGSAQKRTSSGVLQHGSLPLTGAFTTLPRYLRISPDLRAGQTELFTRKCIWLTALSPDITLSSVVDSLTHGFSEQLEMDIAYSPWKRRELDEIGKIAETIAVESDVQIY